MYAKYRLYLQASNAAYVMAASNTVNDLVGQVVAWLNGSIGRGVYSEDVRRVVLYQLNPDTGAYIFSEQRPVVDREDIIRKTRELGGR